MGCSGRHGHPCRAKSDRLSGDAFPLAQRNPSLFFFFCLNHYQEWPRQGMNDLEPGQFSLVCTMECGNHHHPFHLNWVWDLSSSTVTRQLRHSVTDL